MSNQNNKIDSPQSDRTQEANTLFVPFLGEATAKFISEVYTDYSPSSENNLATGETVLSDVLGNLIDYTIETGNFSVDKSTVNGDVNSIPEERVWWHHETAEAGEALIQTGIELRNWLDATEALDNTALAIVWSQGESDARSIGAQGSEISEQYKDATIAIFDYLQTTLGEDIDTTFYLMQTGRYEEVPAFQGGASSERIDDIQAGLEIIQDIQAEIALTRDDVQLATDYSDLDLVFEEGRKYGDDYDLEEAEWSTEPWLVGHNSLQVIGQRLAEYIALDRGENHVLSFTDTEGASATSISFPRDAILDINLAEDSSLDSIEGTDAPDLIAGTYGADLIMAGDGDDVIMAGQGKDTLTGGEGADVFFFDATIGEGLSAHRDLILDFEMGEDGDRLDFYELFKKVDFNGSNPIAQHIRLQENSNGDLAVQFDSDGFGSNSAKTIAVLEGVDLEEFQNNIGQYIIVSDTEF